MALNNERVNVNISHNNKNYYRELGYHCEHGDVLGVLVEQLPKSTSTKIEIRCDYCGVIFDRMYANHMKQCAKDIIKKDACMACAGQKRAESNLLVYGKSSLSGDLDVREKVKKTCLERYGVEAPAQSEGVREKMQKTTLQRMGVPFASQNPDTIRKAKDTMLERYGADSYLKTEEGMKKVRQTNLQRYGVENVFQNEEIRERHKQSCLDKYGVENVFQTETVKKKSKESMVKKYGVAFLLQDPVRAKGMRLKAAITIQRDGIHTSKDQLHIHGLVGGELNYAVDALNLDIAFPEDKIYVEYNGGGHFMPIYVGRMTEAEFKHKEMKRYFYLKSLGWKQIVIESKTNGLPEDSVLYDEIMYAKEHLMKSDQNHYKLYIENGVLVKVS